MGYYREHLLVAGGVLKELPGTVTEPGLCVADTRSSSPC